jgi:protoheme IX farnesyltransferase
VSGIGTPSDVLETSGERARGLDALRALIETTKPGITRMVTITAVVGFVLGAVTYGWKGGLHAGSSWITLIACMFGTALSASGANTLNQWMERERDGRMRRTAGRPLPTRRLSPGLVLGVGVGMALAGLLILWLFANPAASALSAACLLVYLGVYTPLKIKSHWATLVGTVPGALPPLIGWAAAFGAEGSGWASLSHAGGWSLYVLMTVWQIPHFLALAWMYKDDYAAGGYRVLPVIDRTPTSERTCASILGWSVVLVPATLAPVFAAAPHVGWVYGLVAAATGGMYVAQAMNLRRTRTREAARRVFFASIIHLPVLLLVLTAEAVARAWVL